MRDNYLNGKKIFLSGNFDPWTKEELKVRGAILQNQININLDILFIGSDYEKGDVELAKQMDVMIINSDILLQHLSS
ncbi:hypothetical protein D1013_09325 [Euzebyella marina]|uniref:BRCT domain-containing protein n=1 Tax=Euzebyella marina TaxID=1761453 RepID=A0A3G2L5J7_9FLAO|nr:MULTISPECIES: hypothetical protein [Bacteroidota]AYN67549.1 hypothetical protein D1013_09325 [Euzebyella marina]MAU70546.1 hypothetical protein [Pseudozobellia sp.]MBC7000453.1 hypothetical protein [Cytophaga sp. FL35]MBG48034.1 hypothetical protein [Pseudozobellia sp.]|tara:strand:- start:280 stop:510 length:231 start_codon:yes stop_codon:yes gene_type:complete